MRFPQATYRNIFVGSKRAGQRVMESVIYFVEEKLKLKVNRDKSAVDRPWNRKIPGFSFLSNKQATIRLAPKTISRFKEKVRELTDRSWSISMEERIVRLNRYILGWLGYYKLAAAKKHLQQFDQWIRRRLRMCQWKHLKRVRTRIRELPGAWCSGMGLLRDGKFPKRSMGNGPKHK